MSDFFIEVWTFWVVGVPGSYLNIVFYHILSDITMVGERKALPCYCQVPYSTLVDLGEGEGSLCYFWVYIGVLAPQWASTDTTLTGRCRSPSLLLPTLFSLTPWEWQPHYHWAVVKVLTLNHASFDINSAGKGSDTSLLLSGGGSPGFPV